MSSPDYHRNYNRNRYHQRRAWIFSIIGNACAKCGSTKSLEIDHVDATSKSFDVATKWSQPEAELLQELKKCQPLCRSCHARKSIYDRGGKPAVGTHGTLSSYRYCHCLLCRAAKAAYSREYKAKRKALRSPV